MKISNKKLKNGFEMPVFGIGTWHMGGSTLADHSQDKREIEAIQAAIDLGVTHIDTAEIYSAGHAEELVAQAIKDYERKKLFIVSKVYENHLHHKDVLTACKASLKRLQTDYLDLYLIHWPVDEIPLEETLKAFLELKEQGLIKAIGVSNFSIDQLKEAQRVTNNQIANNQIHYSLAYQGERDVVEYCQQNDILVTAYRPVERGMLTEGGIKILDEMCKKYDKTPAQIAINWLISQKNVVTVAKTSSLEHLKENLGAVGWEMEKKDVDKLTKEFPDLGIARHS